MKPFFSKQIFLDYWIENNSSITYSLRILEEIKSFEELLKLNPFLGAETHYRNVRRVIVLENFSLFYKVFKETIQIISVWDNRRNPNELYLK